MQPFYLFYYTAQGVHILIFFWIISISTAYSHASFKAGVTSEASKFSTVNLQLICAIKENNLQRVNTLLLNEKNINNQDFVGYSALHYAAKYAKKAIVERLVEAKALLNQESVRNGYTPLVLAIKRGNKNIVSFLLAAGADPNIVDHKGYNALQLAIQQKRKDLVQLLLQAGANCKTNPSPLLMAIKVRSFPIVQLLLKQKGTIETYDEKGYTELHWAAHQNLVAIFRALLKSGHFKINAKAANGATPLHLIAANPKSKLLKTLLKCPLLKVNVQDVTGSSPLHYAAATNQPNAVNSLLNQPSIKVNIQNNIGQTALHYAVQCQDKASIKSLLIRNDIDAWIKNKQGITPLELAKHYGNNKIYNLILMHISPFKN